MSTLEKVEKLLAELKAAENKNTANDPLREAERLAELYDDIKPRPFVAPIERMAGFPVAASNKASV